MQTHSSEMKTSNDVEVARYDDISPWARRAGISYPIFVDSALRVEVETGAPTPDDPADPHEPLFYLLVPLRFVLSRRPTDTRFGYSIGRKWPGGALAVRVEFRSDEARGDYVELSLVSAAG